MRLVVDGLVLFMKLASMAFLKYLSRFIGDTGQTACACAFLAFAFKLKVRDRRKCTGTTLYMDTCVWGMASVYMCG